MSDEAPKSKTDEEIHKLAMDLVTNRVFMSDQCRRPEDLRMIFLALALADEKTIELYKKLQIVHVYEYYSESLPRSINGYPIFASNYAINKTDYERLKVEEARLRKALEPCPAPTQTSAPSVTPTPQSPKKSSRRKSRRSSSASGSRKRSK